MVHGIKFLYLNSYGDGSPYPGYRYYRRDTYRPVLSCTPVQSTPSSWPTSRQMVDIAHKVSCLSESRGEPTDKTMVFSGRVRLFSLHDRWSSYLFRNMVRPVSDWEWREQVRDSGIDAETPLDITTDGRCLVITPVRDSERKRKFRAALEEGNRRYRKALKRLAD